MEFPLAQFLTTSSVFYTLQVRAYIKKKKADSLWLFYTEPSFQTPTWCCRCSSLDARGCCAFCKKFFLFHQEVHFFLQDYFQVTVEFFSEKIKYFIHCFIIAHFHLTITWAQQLHPEKLCIVMIVENIFDNIYFCVLFFNQLFFFSKCLCCLEWVNELVYNWAINSFWILFRGGNSSEEVMRWHWSYDKCFCFVSVWSIKIWIRILVFILEYCVWDSVSMWTWFFI